MARRRHDAHDWWGSPLAPVFSAECWERQHGVGGVRLCRSDGVHALEHFPEQFDSDLARDTIQLKFESESLQGKRFNPQWWKCSQRVRLSLPVPLIDP